MSYIEKKQLESIAVQYEEDIESATIYPQKGEIEIKTYKRFYDSSGKLVRNENGKTEKITKNVSEIIDKLLAIVKEERKK